MRRIDYSWIILATGFVLLFFNGGSRFAFGLMLKPMSDDLGLSRSSLSLAVTLFMVVSAVAMSVVGRLADRFSLRLIMAASACIAAVGIGLTGRVNSLWQLFLVYGLIYGIGHAGTSIPPVGTMISRWFVRRRGMANAAAISGNGIGQLVLITLLASFLTTLGWRNSFAVLGVVILAVVVPLVLVTVRTSPPPGEALKDSGDAVRLPESAPSPNSIFTSRPLWLLIVMFAICGIQDFLVATHVVAFALDEGVAPVLAGNLLALMGLMALGGVLLSGILADAFGAVRPTALCFILRAGLFSSVLFFQDTAGIVIFALLYGFTFSITAPLTVVFAGNIFGTQRLGTVSGIFSMVHQVAGGLGAFVGALMFDHWGNYDGAFVLMLALSVVALAAILLVRERPLAPAPVTPGGVVGHC